MTKVILLTGATDGIGLEAAKRLISQGHQVLLHGRSAGKLKSVAAELGVADTYRCDLSKLNDIPAFVESVKAKHNKIDVIINNAGVFSTPNPRTTEGLDSRFAVNTLAPYMITERLWTLLGKDARVINVSSAAQWPVDLAALDGTVQLNDNQAYGQSKLAITMWSKHMSMRKDGPTVVAVNPASFLGSKMVKEAYGMEGKDLGIGADILVQAALSDTFDRSASGKYWDNDRSKFANPHPDAMNGKKNLALVQKMDDILDSMGLLN